MELLILAVVFGVAILIYFLPTFVASSRKHPQTTAIFVLNLLMGLTVIGWVVAFVWAFITPQPNQIVITHEMPTPPPRR